MKGVHMRFASQEVNGRYVPYFGKGPYDYRFTPTEELIIERAREKLIERAKKEKLTPAERMSIARGERPGETVDRVPRTCQGFHQLVTKILDNWVGIIHPIDLFFHPNLDVIMQLLWLVRFPIDVCSPYSPDFGVDMMTRKFKMMEWAGPQMVEPCIEDKEDAEFLAQNTPDPRVEGHWHGYLWIMRACQKAVGDLYPLSGSICVGPVVGASYARGLKRFLIDVRRNPEMAELSMKAWTNFAIARGEAMIETLKKGKDRLWECDSIDYLTPKEFEWALPFTYERLIKHFIDMGWPLATMITPPLPHLDLLCRTYKEVAKGIGSTAFGDEHPPIEKGWEVVRKKYNLACQLMVLSKAFIDGPTEEVVNQTKRALKVGQPGDRVILNCAPDYFAKLEWLDAYFKTLDEFGKYPVKM